MFRPINLTWRGFASTKCSLGLDLDSDLDLKAVDLDLDSDLKAVDLDLDSDLDFLISAGLGLGLGLEGNGLGLGLGLGCWWTCYKSGNHLRPFGCPSVRFHCLSNRLFFDLDLLHVRGSLS